MNESQDNSNNSKVVFCPTCGNKCNILSRFCCYCGTPIAGNSSIMKKMQQENQEEMSADNKKANVPLVIVVILLSCFFQPIGVVAFIYAIVCLFSPEEKTKRFGISLLVGFGIVFAFLVIMLGLCIMALSNL